MLVNKDEFEIIKSRFSMNWENDEELVRVINNIEERNENIKKRNAESVRKKRLENPEYGHSKEEIEYMRVCNAKRELGIQ